MKRSKAKQILSTNGSIPAAEAKELGGGRRSLINSNGLKNKVNIRVNKRNISRRFAPLALS
jgi:hypothetical protein